MSPIQQMLLGVGAVATKTYVDDIFSTYLWKGDGNAKIINNGLTFASGLNLPLGTYIQGGYFQGTFTDNSVEYALILAPNGTGNNSGNLLSYGSSSASSGATSLTDGPGNTSTLAAASGDWAAGEWAANLSLNGYSDWYLPAKNEMIAMASNASTLPSGQEWASNWDTWSSTEIDSTYAWMGYMPASNWSNTDNKTKTRLVRAVRRVTVASLSDYNVTGAGGLVWIKQRNGSNDHVLFDTERGAEKALNTNTSSTETTLSNGLTDFLPYGFKINSDARTGASTDTYAGWNFRKAKGFFDIVTYTGNGSNRTIAHSLGCVPGSIWIKQKNGSGEWICYHRSVGAEKFLQVNNSEAENDDATVFQDTEPTASVFSLGTHAYVNSNTDTYVAYLFAGGESTNSLARSVEFDGSNDRLDVAASTDFNLGTNDFTIDYWINTTDTGDAGLMSISNSSQNSNISWMTYMTSGKMQFYWSTNGSSWAGVAQTTKTVNDGQWHHVAITRTGGNIRIYLDGVLDETESISSSSISSSTLDLGIGHIDQTTWFDGKLSNVRIVNGTAVYTSSFKPPTEPLTNITNTKLLCCNDSSTTGKTVGPTITANGPTASTDSPFDDPAGFNFGDAGDQNVIKCGSYVGNGSSDGPEVFLGWEPTFLIVKNINDTEGWVMFDQMRGMHAGGDDKALFPNQNTVEQNRSSGQYWPTPTGFKLDGSSDGKVNGDGKEYVFLAIRRSDGYVGKPPELGTGVFAMDTGNSSSTIPCFDSTFPVDFGLMREPATSSSWLASARLTGDKRTFMNTNDNESSDSNVVFDSNVGYFKDLNSDRQAWMWKRHAGMDVVSFKGTGSAQLIGHTMNGVPEFIILKNRETGSNQWYVYHKDLNNGSNPEDYYQRLGHFGNYAEAGDTNGALFNSTAPTSTVFSVGTSSAVNESGVWTLALLFRSISGVCKTGTYTGNGNSSGPSVTLGFAPRLIILKAADRSGSWFVIDSLRGIGSGSGAFELNTNAVQGGGTLVSSDSTSFTIASAFAEVNDDGKRFIYYAHA